MRRVLVYFIAAILLSGAGAMPSQGAQTPSPEMGLRWINTYREKPAPQAVPQVMRLLSQHGAFRDPDSAGVYVGFLAGVLASNPAKARSIIDKILPLPFEDQWIVVRAVAYSGLPKWRNLMRELTKSLPDRQVMIERYLTGALPTLDEVKLEKPRPGAMDKLKGFFGSESSDDARARNELTFESNPDLIDTLWGFYFATGNAGPIRRVIALLEWSKDKDSIEKLSVGSMAKYTLATNASRDAKLLALLRRLAPHQTKAVTPILQEVIESAETVDTARIRKDALAAVEELKRKGPEGRRKMAWWGRAGETAISAGCLAAAVTGQVQLGLPCVVGGALSSAALRHLASPE